MKKIKEYRGIIIVVLIIVAILVYSSFSKNSHNIRGLEAKLLENKGLAEFDLTNNTKDTTISEKDKARYKEVLDAIQIAGDMKDKTKVQQATDIFNGLINKYQDYADLYVMRSIFSLVLGNTDYDSINTDLNNALKYRKSKKYLSSYDSDTPIYLLKAKVGALSSDNKTEIDNLQSAISEDPSKAIATDFFDTGAVKPNDISNPTALTLSDFDYLVKIFPNDFRVYVFRGLFYASFAIFKEQYYVPAISDLNYAITLNPQSAEANYLLGKLYMNTTFLTSASASDISDITGESGGYKDQQRNKALIYFNKAISIDANYKYSYTYLAETNLQLKNYPEAIQNYSKEIELDPNNAGAYNDRALTELNIAQFDKAINDLSKAIQLKESNTAILSTESYLDMSYQNRADAYIKSGDYTKAIADYSKAIGKKFASQIFIMSIDQIREIYPEFSNISDQDLLEGLRQKYFSNMSSTDFNSSMIKNKRMDSFLLSDLYSSRGDAYLKNGDRTRAYNEYARAMHNDTSYILKPEQQAIYGN